MWLLIPILRVSIPPAVNFDGIRHFLEFLPGAALVAGIGAASLVRLVGRQNTKKSVIAGIVLCLAISFNTMINLKDFGQYQYIYFNKIYGGLPGGKAIFGADEATDYWASSYRTGIEWLNKNADHDAKLYVPVADHILNLVESLWLRDDIEVINAQQYTTDVNEGKTVYVMFITRPGFYDSIATDCITADDPVYDIRVQTVPILEIFKR